MFVVPTGFKVTSEKNPILLHHINERLIRRGWVFSFTIEINVFLGDGIKRKNV